MGYGNSQVKMNLDNMKTAMETCETTVTAVEAVVENVRTTMTELKGDYIGEDANTLQENMENYLDNKVKDVCLNAEAMKKALEQGLENARYCKNYCQHFIDALEGGANGATNDNEEIPGILFYDHDAVEGLMEMCTEAENLGEEIRQSTYRIDNVVDLEVVPFDVTYYTSTVRAECDKIDRLGAHKRNLENYSSFVEITDAELANSLGAIYDTFMDPKSAQIGNLEYGSIDEEILKQQERENALDELEIEMLFEYMSKPVYSLTEEERRIMNEILTVLIENGATGELEKIINYIGNGVAGTWTAGDIYAAARILTYSENTNNEELASAIYNKMKREKMTATVPTEDLETTIYYACEMWLDKRTVQGILNELDPKDDGLTYYSLQRRSKYTASARQYGSSTIQPDSPFELSFGTKDGRLVSVFKAGNKKVKLSSVDMNEVVGVKGIANLKGLKFTDEEAIALLSCIYTDEDITLIGNLAKAATEEEYRKVFQSDPNQLSVYTKMGLYSYSLALLDKNVEYDDKMKVTNQDFTQLEHFINGMLYTRPDIITYNPLNDGEENSFTIDYRDKYLEEMLMVGDIHMDIARTQIEANYSDVPYVRDMLPYFAENVQMISLYATLAARGNEYYSLNTSAYSSISNLGLYDTPACRNPGADMNHVLFSYHDEIKFNDEPYIRMKDGKLVPATATVEIYKYEGEEIFRDQYSEYYVEKAREAKEVLLNAGIDIVVTMVSCGNKIVGIATAAVDIVDSGASIVVLPKEAKEAERRMNAALGGTQIMCIANDMYTKDDRSSDNEVPLIVGCYDTNAFLKMVKLEQEGLEGVSGKEQQNIVDNIAARIDSKVTGADLDDGVDEMTLREMYLLYTTEVYENEDGGIDSVQTISDIDPNRMRIAIDQIEKDYREDMNGFDYISYNLIESEYMGE